MGRVQTPAPGLLVDRSAICGDPSIRARIHNVGGGISVGVLLRLFAWLRLRRVWMNVAILAGWTGFAWWIHMRYLI